jgi:hypothetical protein
MLRALGVAGVPIVVTALLAGSAVAQIREVRGLLGVRYDRLSEQRGSTYHDVLGQARVELFGVVFRPEVASFSVLAESRRGVVTSPPSSILFRIGSPTSVAQGSIRLDVAPSSPVSGSVDYGVTRVIETATHAGSVQHSIGLRGVIQGGAALPVVSLGLRRGQFRVLGGPALRATYTQTNLDLAKSGERSSVSAGLHTDRTPDPAGGPGLHQTAASLAGTSQLSDAVRFSVSGSYAEQRSLFASRSGTVNATLGYLAPSGAAATVLAATDFAGFQGTRTQSQHVRLEATQPVAGGLSAGGTVALRREGGVRPAGPTVRQSALSVAGLAIWNFPLNRRRATVSAQGGYSHQVAAGPDQDSRPRDAVLLAASASLPAVTLDWLPLTSGFQVERLVPAAGRQGSFSYVLSQILVLAAPGAQWTSSAIYAQSETPAILTA